jgi:polyisoprenoid-binding protein YceI
MKKSILSIVIATVVFSSFSFTNPEKEAKEIKLENSQVIWKGYKVTGSHTGTIALKSGSLSFNNDKLIGGEFVMDMPQIITTDLTGEYKDKLEGHLKSDDFFGVAKHPTSTLVFTKVKATGKNSYQITGDLTIKGITNPVTFEMSVYGNKANASLKVDRTKYDVKYGSTSFFDGLADKAIYDEFDLVADLEF